MRCYISRDIPPLGATKKHLSSRKPYPSSVVQNIYVYAMDIDILNQSLTYLYYIEGLVQERHNFSVLAMELCLFALTH